MSQVDQKTWDMAKIEEPLMKGTSAKGVTESKITKQGGAGLLSPKPVPV